MLRRNIAAGSTVFTIYDIQGRPAVGAAVFGWLEHLTGLPVPSVAAAALVLVLLMLWIVSQVKTVPTSKSMPVNSRDAP
jgi:hypothetical protein